MVEIKKVIGVDISTEKVSYGIVDVRGNIIDQGGFPISDYPEITGFVSALTEHLFQIIEKNNCLEAIRSVGISIPSANFSTGEIVNAPNLPWKGVIPLANLLRDQLGLAVAVANNAHCVALGEHTFGSAHGMTNFVALTLNAGVGSCFFTNNKPCLGFLGFAGEVGHSCVKRAGRLCGCGKRGCLEMYAGSRGVVMTAREVLAESDKPSMMREVENLTLQEIGACCRKGDKLALEVFRRVGDMLGMGLANYSSVINPEAIIFTGTVADAGGLWLIEATQAAFEENVFQNIRGKVKFVMSELDNSERNILGASALAWEVKEYSLFI